METDIKIGDKLLCRECCYDEYNGEKHYTLTYGKRYEVLDIYEEWEDSGFSTKLLYVVKNDSNNNEIFSKEEMERFFVVGEILNKIKNKNKN